MFVIGIAGGSCSGKTTLAHRLSEMFESKKVTVINMDRFYKNPTPDTVAPITRIVYPEHNHPDAMKVDEMVAAFNDAINGDSDIVIIEGLFALYIDAIREKLDVKIFADLKSDERIVRRIRKFMNPNQTFDQVVARYLDTVRYRHDELIEPTRWHADMVVNGTLDANKGAAIIKAYIDANV